VVLALDLGVYGSDQKQEVCNTGFKWIDRPGAQLPGAGKLSCWPRFPSACSISINGTQQLINSYPYNIITSDKMSHSNINHGDASSSSNAHYSNNTHSFNCTHFSNNDFVWNIGATDEKSEILAWLSPLEPRIRHQHLRTLRADNVGEWLLRTEEFQRWCDVSQEEGSENPILFCCGGPAIGKTYLR